MKINSRTLADFVKKVSINGSITDGLLKFGPDGLTLTVKDITMSGAVTGLLKSTNFVDYSQMNVPIKSMSMFLSVLGTMNGMVELSKQDNIFRIVSDSNEADLMMPEEQYLECSLAELPVLGHDGGFELDSTIWGTVKKNTQILGTTKVGIIAEVKNKVLYLRTGENNFDKMTTKVPVDYKDVVTKYGCTFLEFISVISGKVNVAFEKDYPMLITSKDTDSTIKWMISPIIDKDAATEEVSQEA
jgi:hypothetical protein